MFDIFMRLFLDLRGAVFSSYLSNDSHTHIVLQMLVQAKEVFVRHDSSGNCVIISRMTSDGRASTRHCDVTATSIRQRGNDAELISR